VTDLGSCLSFAMNSMVVLVASLSLEHWVDQIVESDDVLTLH